MDGEQRLRRGPGTHYYMFAPPGRNVGTTVCRKQTSCPG